MTSLEELECSVSKMKLPEIMALAQISTYVRFREGKLNKKSSSVREILAVREVVRRELSSAIVSPNPYIREWGRFVQNECEEQAT